MTITAWPFNGADTSESQFERWARSFTDSGTDGTPAGTECKVTGDNTGMQVKIGIGFGIVSGTAFYNDSIITLAVGAASGIQRNDLIVARRSLSGDSVVFATVAGVTAATDPAVTQTLGGVWEEIYGRANVGPATTSLAAGQVDDLRRYLAEPVGKWTTNRRPGAPKIGKSGFNFTTGKPEYWDGTEWRVPGYNAEDLTAGTMHRPTDGDHTGLIQGKGFSIQQATPTPVGVGHVWIGW